MPNYEPLSSDIEQRGEVLPINPQQPSNSARRKHYQHVFNITTILFTVLIADAARGIVLPSLNAGIFAQGGSVADVGSAVSAVALGRGTATLPFSYWSERRTTRESLLIATVIASAGHLVYAFVAGKENLLMATLASRYLVGFGTGIMGVCRGYLAANSSLDVRTRYISYAGLFQFIGFSLAPIIGSTAFGFGQPGFVMVGLNVLVFVLLLFISEGRAELSNEQKNNINNASVDETTTTTADAVELVEMSNGTNIQSGPSTSDRLLERNATSPGHSVLFYGFVVFLVLNLVLRGILADTEVIGPITQQSLIAREENVVEASGHYFIALGLFGCIMYLGIDPLIRCGFSEHFLFVFGMFGLAVGSIFVAEIVSHQNLPLFTFGAVLIWCISNPLLQTMTISMYSKSLGSKPQAVWLSWLTMAGSSGRIIFPFFATRVPNIALCVGHIVLCFACIILYGSFYRWVSKQSSSSS